jgi:four helix bundle protein
MRDFRNYQVWHRSHHLAAAIFIELGKSRRIEHAGLRSQLRDSADSVPANIVEGSAAASQKEFARFLGMSIKSANETEYHLLVARDRGAIRRDTAERFVCEIVEIRKMLFSLRRTILIGR